MMRQFNPPIPEAVNEGFLPHPSDFNAALQLLDSGDVNLSSPYFIRVGSCCSPRGGFRLPCFFLIMTRKPFELSSFTILPCFCL
jgi:hypothetical protein